VFSEVEEWRHRGLLKRWYPRRYNPEDGDIMDG